MKTPDFWKTNSRLSQWLQPLAWLYEVGYLVKRAFTVQVKLPVPIVCIGNITAGGSGKTPVALHLGTLFKERGVKAFYVSRGYGGSAKEPVLVNATKDHSGFVGDEPLLLAQILPTVVGKNRLDAATFAISKGADLLIFDDGFQNKKIYKDFSFLVMDGAVGMGNGKLLPAGSLRERLSRALLRAHAVIMINPMSTIPTFPENKMVLFARTQPTGLALRLSKQKVVAFCGIAFPEKFNRTLLGLNAQIIAFKAFGDHASYDYKMLKPLAQKAADAGAYLVTTRKDYVRLPKGYKDKVIVVDIELEFADPDALAAQLNYIIGLVGR